MAFVQCAQELTVSGSADGGKRVVSLFLRRKELRFPLAMKGMTMEGPDSPSTTTPSRRMTLRWLNCCIITISSIIFCTSVTVKNPVAHMLGGGWLKQYFKWL